MCAVLHFSYSDHAVPAVPHQYQPVVLLLSSGQEAMEDPLEYSVVLVFISHSSDYLTPVCSQLRLALSCVCTQGCQSVGANALCTHTGV